MHREEKKEEIRGFYSSLLVSIVTVALIMYAAVLKFSVPPESITKQHSTNKQQIEIKEVATRVSPQEQSAPPIKDAERIRSGASVQEENKIAEPFKEVLPFRKGSDFHASGNFNAAAAAWEKMLRSSEYRSLYTIQLLLACKKETISKAFENAGRTEELFYVRSRYKDMTCYKLCMGLFNGREEAEKARLGVSEYFAGMGNRPIIVPVANLIEGMAQ